MFCFFWLTVYFLFTFKLHQIEKDTTECQLFYTCCHLPIICKKQHKKWSSGFTSLPLMGHHYLIISSNLTYRQQVKLVSNEASASAVCELDWRAGSREGGVGAAGEWVEGEMWADWEKSTRTTSGRGKETCRGNPVSQEDQPTAQGTHTVL